MQNFSSVGILTSIAILSACQGEVTPGDDNNVDIEAIGANPDNGSISFSQMEVDYKSPIPGLDIVRVNPLLASKKDRNGLAFAHNTGWNWNFETNISHPFYLDGTNDVSSTSVLEDMGKRVRLYLQSADGKTVVRGNGEARDHLDIDNSVNYARGLFYDMKWDGWDRGFLTNLASNITSHFEFVLSGASLGTILRASHVPKTSRWHRDCLLVL